MNGGTCHEGEEPGTYRCQCLEGFGGHNCDVKVSLSKKHENIEFPLARFEQMRGFSKTDQRLRNRSAKSYHIVAVAVAVAVALVLAITSVVIIISVVVVVVSRAPRD